MNAVSVRNLTVRYDGIAAVSDVSVDIGDGEFVGLIGPNGGGKSTFIKAMLGLIPIEKGTVELLGGSIRENRSRVGYVPQSSELNRRFPISVLEAVQCAGLRGPFHPFYRRNREDRRRAEEELERVGISRLADRRIADLSGGEFQRVLIARALAGDPELLLLDEPDAGIDPVSREEIYRILSSLNGRITTVLVTHDHLAISSAVSSLICLDCRLVYHGPADLSESEFRGMYGGRQ